MITEFFLSGGTDFVLLFEEHQVSFFAQHGILIAENGAFYKVATPYAQNDVNELQFAQNGDILYIFHKNYPIKTLTRYGNTDWRLEDFDIKNGPWDNVNTSDTTLKISRTTGTARVTASADLFKETDLNRLIRLTVVDDTNTAWQAEESVSQGQILYSDNKYYEAQSGGTTGTVKPVHSEGTKSDGSILFKYMHAGYGQGKIVRYISPTEVDIEIDGTMPQSLVTKATDYWELGLLHSGAENPMCGTFFRNRFAFMLNKNGIPQVCLSCSDDYNNFADKDQGEVLAINAITVPVTNAKYNSGCWLSASDVLFVGTSSAEFIIDSASSAEALSPDNVKIQSISENGSLPITPVKVGAHTIFAKNNGIRDIEYSYINDSYDPVDLSLFGKHLFNSTIKDMVYQENPDKIIWFVLDDGRLIGITFSSEQNVSAVHQHYLNGKIRSLAVIPNPDNNLTDLWLEIDRDGKICIEYMDNGYPLQYPDDINQIIDYEEKEEEESLFMKENSFYVDGGLSLTREVGTSGVFRALSSNLYNRECLYNDTSETEYNKKYITEFDNTVPFTITRFSETTNRGYMNFQFHHNEEDSKTYTVGLDDKFIGKRFACYVWYTSSGQNIAEKVYDSTLETSEITLTVSRNDFYSISFYIYSEIEKDNVFLTGLDHLEGKDVAIMIDGAEYPRQTVQNGGVYVPWDAKQVTVGLPIESMFIPQTLIIGGNNGSGIGDVQRIDHVTLMLWRSSGGKIGDKYSNLQDIYFRKTDDEMDSSAPLYTGNKEISVSLDTTTIKEKGATVLIYNDSVFPMNILAIAPHMTTSGNWK